MIRDLITVRHMLDELHNAVCQLQEPEDLQFVKDQLWFLWDAATFRLDEAKARRERERSERERRRHAGLDEHEP